MAKAIALTDRTTCVQFIFVRGIIPNPHPWHKKGTNCPLIPENPG